jgi:biotin transport system substrate-specific component
MARPLYAETIRPLDARMARVYDVLLIAGFSLVIALCAQVAIPLPFTPVPVTLQTLAVIVAGGLLGSARGTAAVLAYIGEGFAGLPVFSGGRAGVAHLFGPTGGYLVGFVLAAFLVGLLVEHGAGRSWLATCAALVAGSLIIYVPGAIWLGAFTGMQKALALGVTPFLIGDALKTIVGCGIVSGVTLGRWKARGT